MKYKNLLPFLIALFIHVIPLSFYAFRCVTNSLHIPTPSSDHRIGIQSFALSRRSSHNDNSNSKQFKINHSIASANKSDQVESSANIHEAEDLGVLGNQSVFSQMHGPKYPLIARKNGLEGKVKIKAFYNTDGDIVQIEITESSGVKFLDDAVRVAVFEWKLKTTASGSFIKDFEFKLNN